MNFKPIPNYKIKEVEDCLNAGYTCRKTSILTNVSLGSVGRIKKGYINSNRLVDAPVGVIAPEGSEREILKLKMRVEVLEDINKSLIMECEKLKGELEYSRALNSVKPLRKDSERNKTGNSGSSRMNLFG